MPFPFQNINFCTPNIHSPRTHLGRSYSYLLQEEKRNALICSSEICLKQTRAVPDRLRGELVGVSFPPDTGETCHVVTGGGVSHELPDADLRRCPPPGGVPIIN